MHVRLQVRNCCNRSSLERWRSHDAHHELTSDECSPAFAFMRWKGGGCVGFSCAETHLEVGECSLGRRKENVVDLTWAPRPVLVQGCAEAWKDDCPGDGCCERRRLEWRMHSFSKILSGRKVHFGLLYIRILINVQCCNLAPAVSFEL